MKTFTIIPPKKYANENELELVYKPKKNTFKYYQLCVLKNPWTNKYDIRKFVFNELGECQTINELKITQKQFDNFKETHKPNIYKCYSTYDLKNVSMPTSGEFLNAESTLLDDNIQSYNGYGYF